MSLYPSVGSTVTRVLTNKSGTTAKLEFSDGTSILVKYEALVIDTENSDVIVKKPVKHESKIVMSGGMKRLKPASNKAKSQLISESQYKEMASKVLKQQQNRSDKLFSQWEQASGQFNHAAGPLTNS